MVQIEEYLSQLNKTQTIQAHNILAGLLGSAAAVFTIFGNALVIVTILVIPDMRTRSNVLIASLAVADLIVGVIVMPLSVAYDVQEMWPYPKDICDFWISVDVISTTTSIFHIGAISVDRYLTIRDPFRYQMMATVPKLIVICVALWLLGIFVAILPINFGWNEASGNVGPEINDPQCYFINNKTYALVTGIMIFYLPLLIMSGLYLHIFKIARSKMRQVRAIVPSELLPQSVSYNAETVTTDVKSSSTHQTKDAIGASSEKENIPTTSTVNNREDIPKKGQIITSKSNYKAARTLGMIMGAFFVSWFPFFLIYTVHPFKPSFVQSPRVSKFAIWLGYLNSSMNPVIYTMNSEFRKAFKKVLRMFRGDFSGMY